MPWKLLFSTMILTAALGFGLTGCGQCGPGLAPKQATNAPPPVGAVTPASAAEDVSGLSELNEADRKLAEKQKICPKTRELLGSMGKPYKMTLKGREIFLCCEGCKEAVEKDPDKYLKILDDYAAKGK